jgi:gluconokinase
MRPPPAIIVLMGPAGAGKTTVGQLLAQSLGWHFLEADDFHSADNVERMRRGIPLTDADREPWLRAICETLRDAIARHDRVVLACSALKEKYRQSLVPSNAEGQVRFVYLRAPASLLRQRLERRTGHYAGPELLESQLETLEEPRDALWVDASREPQEIVAQICRELAL